MAYLTQYTEDLSSTAIDRRIITSNTTVTFPVNGKLIYFAVGGGGSGAARSSAKPCYATGGGAGQIAFELGIPILAGDAYTFAIGQGGTAVSVAAGANGVGVPGGNTVISGPNSYSVTVSGGLGGATGTTSISGGAGGSGGSGTGINLFRFSGGAGGSITHVSSGAAATGGGAVNFFGLSSTGTTRGGNVSVSSTGNYSTGGGGIGGVGSDTTTTASTYTAGGGSGGPALAQTTTGASTTATMGPNYNLELTTASPTFIAAANLFIWGIDIFGGGGYGTTPAGNGAGSAGFSATTSTLQIPVGSFFGGHGGIVSNTANITFNAAARPGYGGGGGAAAVGSATYTAVSTAGGNGVVVYVFIKDNNG